MYQITELVYDILISTFTKTDFTLPSKKVGPAWKKRADTGLQILTDNKILYDIQADIRTKHHNLLS